MLVQARTSCVRTFEVGSYAILNATPLTPNASRNKPPPGKGCRPESVCVVCECVCVRVSVCERESAYVFVYVCVRVCAWGGGIEARSKLVYVYMRVTVESKPEDSRK
jgi:hypothetical protein